MDTQEICNDSESSAKEFVARNHLTEVIDSLGILKSKLENKGANLMLPDSDRDTAKAAGSAYGFCIIRLLHLLPSPPLLDPSQEKATKYQKIDKADLQTVIEEIVGLIDMSESRSNDIAQATAAAYKESLLHLQELIQ